MNERAHPNTSGNPGNLPVRHQKEEDNMRYEYRTPREVKQYEKEAKEEVRKVLFMNAIDNTIVEGTAMFNLGDSELPAVGDIIELQTGQAWEWTPLKVIGIGPANTWPERRLVWVEPTTEKPKKKRKTKPKAEETETASA
jgi:hypothetical protein